MSTVDGAGRAVGVPPDGAAAVADGDGLADELHAVASMTTTVPIRKVLVGANPGRFIGSSPP
jgi:hypothetical protein